MLLYIDNSFSSADASSLGALEGLTDFCNLVNESMTILTCNLLRSEAWLAHREQLDASRTLAHYEFARQEAGSTQPLVILTSLDLTGRLNDQYLNFVFGTGSTSVCLVSTYRFGQGELTSAEARLCNRLITMHELGHVWSLVPAGTARSEQRTGLYTGHCTNLCTMQQVVSVAEAFRLSVLLQRAGHDFCDACRTQLTNSGS